MATSLDKLKETVSKVFAEAVERHRDYVDSNYSGASTPFNPKIENRNAIAALAQTLVAIEREQREQRLEKEEAERRTLPGKKLAAGG